MLEEFQSRVAPYRYFTFFFSRGSDDIFRISIELILLLWVFTWIKWSLSRAKWVFATTYFGFLIYMIYDASFKKIYHFKPILANDITLIKYGTEIIWSDTPWLIFVGLVAFTVTFWLILRVSRFLITGFDRNQIHRSRAFQLVSLLCILSLYKLHLHPLLFDDKKHLPIVEQASFNVVTFSIMRNVTQSIQLQKKISDFNISDLAERNEKFNSQELNEKPNIYLIFIESYGKVLYDHAALSTSFSSLLDKYENRLKGADVFSVSRFSDSPVSGGGSWLAYTSMLYGEDIATQGLYQKLVNDNEFHQVPNFLKWLQNQGYQSVFLSPLATSKRVPDYDVYGKFYGVDKWVKPHVFEHFTGTGYGWGSIPPDQYLLHYTIENYFQSSKPNVLFFLTKNSHSPFKSPTVAVDDWKKLEEKNTPDQTSYFSDKPTPDDYLNAINYELDYLTKFAVNLNEKDVLIIVGDHQPPVITQPEDGSETMIHLLSKNSEFIDSFQQYGFSSGLHCLEQKDGFAHQDILQPLTSEIINAYGQ